MDGQVDHMSGAASHHEQGEARPESPGKARRTPGHKEEIRRIKRQISQKKQERALLSREVHASRRSGDSSEYRKQLERQKSNKQEIFSLQQHLRAVKREAGAPPETGAVPDFAIIGAPKCGTTFLYHLLVKHPHVRPAAFKEVHYFDLLYPKGAEWYRRCFPSPDLRDGQRTITGEATPSYLAHPSAPGGMAEIAPQARLIALLRNPVDRVYSSYHFFGSRRGRNTNEFERHAEAALEDPGHRVLAQSIYVDQLSRWSEFFPRGQMLVLKSEDFFEDPRCTLNAVLDFLELPAWEPDASELGERRNKGPYERGMDQDTRRRLEEFYEPHNRRLYEYLGVDFGW